MYSYEERVRAVELYLKLGKRIKATIRQLGYPTKNSLKVWCDEFEKSGSLQKGYVRDSAIETVTEDDETPIVHSDRGGDYRWPG
jgi:transposase-like protein